MLFFFSSTPGSLAAFLLFSGLCQNVENKQKLDPLFDILRFGKPTTKGLRYEKQTIDPTLYRDIKSSNRATRGFILQCLASALHGNGLLQEECLTIIPCILVICKDGEEQEQFEAFSLVVAMLEYPDLYGALIDKGLVDILATHLFRLSENNNQILDGMRRALQSHQEGSGTLHALSKRNAGLAKEIKVKKQSNPFIGK